MSKSTGELLDEHIALLNASVGREQELRIHLAKIPKVIRRVYEDRNLAGQQILVEVWVDEGVVKVATRTYPQTWGPPLKEVLNEDESRVPS